MSKKIILGTAVAKLVSDLAAKMPADKIEGIERNIQSDLAKKLGKSWTDLPATGPYMVIVYVVMNTILIPLGISPSAVADSVIAKSKEWELDDKANKLITNTRSGVQAGGEFTTEKYHEISSYLKENMKNMDISARFKEELDEASKFMKEGLNKGKDMVGKLFSKKSEESE